MLSHLTPDILRVNKILFQYSPNRSTEYSSKSFAMKRFTQYRQYSYGTLVEEEDSKKSTATPSSQSSSSTVNAYTTPQNRDWSGDGEKSRLTDTGKNSNKWYNTPSMSGTFGKRWWESMYITVCNQIIINVVRNITRIFIITDVKYKRGPRSNLI